MLTPILSAILGIIFLKEGISVIEGVA